MIRKLLIVVPLALVLTAVSLFMPAQRVSIDSIGKLSFDTAFNFFVGPGTAYASPDWLGTWAKRVKITIDSDDISENLTHFPVLIYLSDACGIGNAYDLTPVFDEVGANSKRIAVTKADEVTQLYVEIEKWDETAEEAWLWVSKSDWTISSTSDTDIYLYYDNSQPDNTTYVGDVGSRTEVWNSNFEAVYHLSEASGGSSSLEFVNETDGYGSGWASTIAADAASHTAGNLLAVIVANNGYFWERTVSSISDTAGNTYTYITSITDSSAQYIHVEIWYAKNISGNANNVVTATFSGSARYREISVLQYSGADTSDPYDVSNTGTGTGTSQTTNASTTTFADEVIVAGYYEAATGTSTAGTNFTLRYDGTYLGTEDRIVSSTGSYGSAMTYSVSTDYVAVHATFKAAFIPDTVKDSTANANHGTDYGSPTFGATGQINGAISLDGDDDYLDMSSMNPQSYDDFTVSAWYKASHSAVVDDEFIFSHLVDNADGPGIVLSITDDSSYADYLRVSIYDNSSNYTPYYGTSDVVDQQCHYVVGTRGGGRIKLYVDGTNETDAADVDNGETINVNAPSGPHIGDLPGDSEQVYGILDEVRVSDTARSAAWIDASYESERDDLLDFGSEETAPSVDISNTPDSYDFGKVTDNETYATGLAYFTVTNNSGAAVDITIQGTDMETQLPPNFPSVAAVNGGNDTTNQSNHTVNLPSGISSGDLLLEFFASDGNPTITFPGGWTQLFQTVESGTAYYDVISALGPDYWWKLDGDETDSADDADSDGGVDPSWVSSIIPSISGTNECGDYNGSSSVTDIPDQSDINTGTTTLKSISVWINADTIDTSGNGRCIWSEGGTYNWLALYVFNDGGTPKLYFCVGEGSGNYIDYISYQIATDTLYHVGATMDAPAGELRLHLDGSEVANKTGGLNIGTSLSAHSADIAIGGVDGDVRNHASSTMSGYFDGEIADVVYWAEQTVLDEDDFDSIYEAGQERAVKFGAWYRIADGTEGASINVTTSSNEMTAHTSYRITGYSGTPEVGTPATGSTANPDPSVTTPSGGAEDTLWFACCGYNRNRTVSAYSANYTNGRNDYANSTEGCGVGTCRRELNAASEDPGTFTISASDQWVAATVAVAPVPVSPYTWTLSDTCTPAEDVIGFMAGLQNGSYNVIVRKNSPYNNLITGLADSANQSWGLELHTPTNITEYGEQLEGTITLTATLS